MGLPPIGPELLRRREEILAVLSRHSARNPRIASIRDDGAVRLGSLRIAELLVEWADGDPDPVRWGSLQGELSTMLGFQVDIVTEPTLEDARRQQVMRDAPPL